MPPGVSSVMKGHHLCISSITIHLQSALWGTSLVVSVFITRCIMIDTTPHLVSPAIHYTLTVIYAPTINPQVHQPFLHTQNNHPASTLAFHTICC